jgi:hypothetical protein
MLWILIRFAGATRNSKSRNELKGEGGEEEVR